MLNNLLFIVILLIFISINVWYNYYIIVKEKTLITKQVHITLFIIRTFFLLLLSACFANQTGTDFQSFISLSKYMFLGGSIFWLLFDSAINYTRELPIFYLGANNILDNIFKKYEILYFILKLVVFITSIVIFVI